MAPFVKRLLIATWRTVAGLRGPSGRTNARLLRERGEAVADLTIRDATPADIPELAQLHVTTWNATYAPLLMKGPSVALREHQWREKFSKADGRWFCLVVTRANGDFVGFAQGNRSDNPDFAGELNKIYLLREYQRIGVGRRLLDTLARAASRWLAERVHAGSRRFAVAR